MHTQTTNEKYITACLHSDYCKCFSPYRSGFFLYRIYRLKIKIKKSKFYLVLVTETESFLQSENIKKNTQHNQSARVISGVVIMDQIGKKIFHP